MRLLSAALVATMLAAAPAPAQERATFAVQGTNPNGSAYSGQLEATKRPDGSWTLTWRVGESVVRGIGLVQGEVFSAAFATGGAEPGLATYSIMPDGRLDGSWTAGEGVGREVLTPR